MPYFILGCVEPLPDERRGVVAAHAGGLDWLSGARFETPPPSPVRVTLDAEGVMLPMFQHPVPLFVDAMVSALFECGADNLEQCRQQVAGVRELVADLAPRRDAFGP